MGIISWFINQLITGGPHPVGIGENQTKNAIMYSQKEMGICEPLDLKLMEVFLQEKNRTRLCWKSCLSRTESHWSIETLIEKEEQRKKKH